MMNRFKLGFYSQINIDQPTWPEAQPNLPDALLFMNFLKRQSGSCVVAKIGAESSQISSKKTLICVLKNN